MKNLLTLTAIALTTACASINPEVRTAFNKARDLEYENKFTSTARNPKETEILGKGNCFDKAAYLKYLLDNEGYNSRVRIGTYQTSPTHAWLEMDYKDKKIILDPTIDFFGEDKRGDYVDLTKHYDNLRRFLK